MSDMSDFNDVVRTLHGWLGHTVDAEIVFRSEARIATMRGESSYATEALGGVESPETLHFTVGGAEFTLDPEVITSVDGDMGDSPGSVVEIQLLDNLLCRVTTLGVSDEEATPRP